MSNLENQVAAITNFVLASSFAEREKARDDLVKLMNGSAPKKPVKKDAESIAREILLELGAPEHLMGHPYTVQAILLVAGNRMYINNITYGLYPQLAANFDTTASGVERAIRHLIEVTWTRGDPDVLNKYFGNTISADKGKPTNGEFIARIANVVNLRLMESE